MAFTFTALADVTDNTVTWPTGPRSVTLFEVGHYFMCEWPLPQYQCCLSPSVLTARFTTTQRDVTLSGSTPSHAAPNYARMNVNCEAFTETFLWVVRYCCPQKVKRIIVKYDGRKLMYTDGSATAPSSSSATIEIVTMESILITVVCTMHIGP
jgi:hypothetical protein